MVEDSATDADIIQRELKKLLKNALVEIVFTEKTFRKSLKTFDPQLILSDFSMPGFDGLSALKIAKKVSPGVPFVFVSGTIGEERAIEAMKSGATDYVIKDRLSALGPKIKRALKESTELKAKKNAEEQLRIREQQLADSQRVGNIGSWRVNFETGEVVWSEHCYELFGIKDKSKKITQETFFSLINPDDLAAMKEAERKAIAERGPLSFNFRINRHGETRYFYSKAEIKFNKLGQMAGLIGTVLDITDLKKVQLELEEKNRELRLFIYKSSHDLRAPISSALGLCNLADKALKESPEAKGHVEMISTCLQKLDRIVGTLTETMAIRDHKLNIQKVDFKEILENVQGSIRHVNGYSRIKFNLEGLDTECWSDPKVLRSVFQNLIENSVKYQNHGTREPFIDIRIEKTGSEVKVTLADNGIGINKSVQDKVFDMFFRAHETSKGSGLGLYIVKNAIEKLKGSITLESKETVGSTFKMILPQSGS